jgi:hypothetical protein
MSQKQTRRSVSISGDTYNRLGRFAAERDQSMSKIVEEQLAALFEVEGEPAKAAPPKPADKSLATWLASDASEPTRNHRARGKGPPNPTAPLTRAQRIAAGIAPRTPFNNGPRPNAEKAAEKAGPGPQDGANDPARSRPAPRSAKDVAPRLMPDPWGLLS